MKGMLFLVNFNHKIKFLAKFRQLSEIKGCQAI